MDLDEEFLETGTPQARATHFAVEMTTLPVEVPRCFSSIKLFEFNFPRYHNFFVVVFDMRRLPQSIYVSLGELPEEIGR